MKYIRTKDGKIIDLTSKQVSSYEIVDDKKAVDEYGEDSGFIMVYYYDHNIGEHIEYDGKGGCSMDNWYLEDILKQADTIEELCDEFVIENKKDYLHINYANNDKQAIKVVLGNINKEEWFIYGAIWTNKGLIYVAKMNEKGELELL